MSAQAELLERLGDFVDANNRSGYYQALADAGYDYGRLALGVVDNLTLNGRLANAFQYNKGQELDNPVYVTGALSEKIGLDLMHADFTARQREFDERGDVILKIAEIRDYHIEVYGLNSVPPEAWTAYAPSILIGNDGFLFENGDSWWEWVLSTGDFLLSQLGSGLGTVAEVVSYNDALADEWLGDLFLDGVLDQAAGSDGPALTWERFTLQYGNGLVVGGEDRAEADLVGAGGSDTIYGHGGNDELDGKSGDDFLYGGYGDDVLVGGAGRDALIGGVRGDAAKAYHDRDGMDTADYSSAGQGIVVNLREKPDWFPNAEGWVQDDGDGGEDALDSIETIIGSAHDDTFFGGETELVPSSPSPLYETITLDGGDGTDVVDYSKLDFEPTQAGLTIRLAKPGVDEPGEVRFTNILGFGPFNALIAIENVVGSSGKDRITGNDEFNVLIGGEGDDEIRGEGGEDIIVGGEGYDQLWGGDDTERDIFYVGAGDTVHDASKEDKISVEGLRPTGGVVPLHSKYPIAKGPGGFKYALLGGDIESAEGGHVRVWLPGYSVFSNEGAFDILNFNQQSFQWGDGGIELYEFHLVPSAVTSCGYQALGYARRIPSRDHRSHGASATTGLGTGEDLGDK